MPNYTYSSQAAFLIFKTEKVIGWQYMSTGMWSSSGYGFSLWAPWVTAR
jgi:hypothetical protein